MDKEGQRAPLAALSLDSLEVQQGEPMTLKRTPRPKWMETVEFRPEAEAPLPDFLQPGRPDLAIPSAELGDMSAIQAEADRQRILSQAAGVAQGAARDAVREMQEEDRQKKDAERATLAPFLGYLQSLRMRAEDDPEDAPRTELKMTLQRMEGTGGPKPRRIFCTEETLDNAGAVAMGDPCLEQRTQDYAERAGKFGRYEWRIRGWVAGSLTLDTSAVVNVEPPPGYVSPVSPQVEQGAPPVDPLGGLEGALGIVSQVSRLLGHQPGGASQGISYEAADRMKAAAYEQGQKAGKVEGRWEADRDHRKELDEHRDRARTREEDAERRGLDRGRLEGAREVRAELDPRIWKLEHETSPEGGPSIVQEIVGAMGGPNAMQALVGGIVQAMNAPPKSAGTGTPARPAAQPRNVQPLRTAPPVRPNPTPAPQAPHEPTRAEHYEALGQLEEALGIVEEAIEQAEPGQTEQAERFQVLALAFHVLGLGDGPMGGWWAEWRKSWRAQVQTLIHAHEAHEAMEAGAEAPEAPATPTTEGTAPMDFNAMKTLLLDRLEQTLVLSDAEILAEVEGLTTPEERAEWRALLGGWPVAMVAGAICDGKHAGRLAGLLEAFKAGA